MSHEYIYRIVNKTGRGMYRSTNERESLWDEAVGVHNNRIHPLPFSDGISRYIDPEFRFGFRDIEQMKEWTIDSETRTALERCGGRVHVYRVPKHKIVYGNRQVMYPAASARLVRKCGITELCD